MSETKTIDFSDYCEFVTNLISKESVKDFNAKLATGGLGLAGEAGEIAEKVNDVVEGFTPWCWEIREDLINELGDQCYYLAFATKHILEDRCLEDYYDVTPLGITVADPTSNLRIGSMALCSFSGEVADIVKKVLFHGLPWDEKVKQKLFFALGNVFWTVDFLANNGLGTTMQEVMQANVKKLSKRYKNLEFSTHEFMEKEAAKASTP